MLISKNHIHNFKKWDNFLTSLGYKNYTQCLNAKDYGIPQNRNRVFMVSIFGDYNYKFPRKQKLKNRLKDLLEQNVNEKYYLSDKQIEDIKHWNAYEKPLETMEKTDKNNYSPTLTTRSGAYAAGMILVKNATQKGYLEAQVGDGIDISSRMQKHRGTVQKNSSQTLTTKGGNDVGVVVKQRACCENKLATTPKTKVLLNNLRIRKLTPKECCRLMGFEDSDYETMAEDLSDMAIYHCCGDSIVVNVLEKIFGEMIWD